VVLLRRKRIQAIRERDLELTIAEQTPKSHAFLYKRTEEKFHNLEVMTMEIVESKSVSSRDRLSAMEFLRQIYEEVGIRRRLQKKRVWKQMVTLICLSISECR
jgi:hypothetical protein